MAMEPNLFDTAAVLMILAAVFGWVNHRWLKLPFAIGLLVSALMASAGVLAFDRLVPGLHLRWSASTSPRRSCTAC